MSGNQTRPRHGSQRERNFVKVGGRRREVGELDAGRAASARKTTAQRHERSDQRVGGTRGVESETAEQRALLDLMNKAWAACEAHDAANGVKDG